jgi:AmmeMemoRadiSam system protein B
LNEPAMQGTLAEPDLRGWQPAEQALLATERGKTAVIFDRQAAAETLLPELRREVQAASPEATVLYSLAATTRMALVKTSHVPRATSGPAIRPPAVAGTFYPADAHQLARLVDQCLSGSCLPAESWPAVMVPHAGLSYSGRIAGQTLVRVRVPPAVIVIGPKHTPHGMEWSVAPHQTWSIPGGNVPADPQLAQQLVAAIPGLALDAAAHAQEHAIEVELPFLARLSPQSSVVGIVIGAGDLARCRDFAAGLAQVVSSLPEPPLLVISSDMNHFASDEENRRLDEIALSAMETLDPERLYDSVKREHISMCGVLPAVIVMETLRLLGRLNRASRVAYATSADVSGDKRRVVGYAGMLLGP